MKKILLFYIFISVGFGAVASSALDAFTKDADQLLKSEVKNGQVDYQAVKKAFQTIDQLYKQLGSMNLQGATDKEKKAFFINAYNIVVIHEIAKYYPLKSPMDKSGFFDKVKHQVAGEELTLNALEINKLVKPFKDPRVHFALACAAKSCPPLASFAYTPEKMDEQLDSRTRKSLNDADFIKVDEKNKTVEVSKIFDWYKNDFTQNGQTVLAFINQYRNQKIPSGFKVGYYEYNWQLNDQA